MWSCGINIQTILLFPGKHKFLKVSDICIIINYMHLAMAIWAECNNIIYRICASFRKPDYMMCFQIRLISAIAKGGILMT